MQGLESIVAHGELLFAFAGFVVGPVVARRLKVSRPWCAHVTRRAGGYCNSLSGREFREPTRV